MKSMRNHLPAAMDIVLCCAILHNIAIEWRSDEPEEEEEEEEDLNADEDQDIEVIDDDLDNAAIRARGAIVRENLRQQMPPPSVSERRMLNI